MFAFSALLIFSLLTWQTHTLVSVDQNQQQSRADAIESPTQFLFFSDESCESVAESQLAPKLPAKIAKLQYQALYEHMIGYSTSSHLLVGARNLALNVSIYPQFDITNSILWTPADGECTRLIRTFLPTNRNNDAWLICDATRLQECRAYSNGTRKDYSLDGVSRLSNDDRAAAHYSADTDRLYFVGVIDQWYAQYDIASANDISYERRVAAVDYVGHVSDANTPFFDRPKFNFHSLQELDDKIYLFYEEAARETAFTYESQRSERRVARVAQICKGDPGYFPDRREEYPVMTTFRKVRLSCRIGGTVYESGIEYDSFAAASRFGKVRLEDGREKEVFYAAFNYQNEFVRRSAVCAYDLSALRNLFAQSREHYVLDRNVRWKPLDTVTSTSGANASLCLAQSSESINFVRKHPLLTSVLNPIDWLPIFVTNSTLESAVTAISVDWQVRAADSRVYNVLYLGTDSGKVLKVAVDAQVTRSSTLIDSLNGEAVLSVHLAGASQAERVVSVLESSIASSPTSQCAAYLTCQSCVSSRDVYCSWLAGSCKRSDQGLADIRAGNTSSCPQEEVQESNPEDEQQQVTTVNSSVVLLPKPMEAQDALPSNASKSSEIPDSAADLQQPDVGQSRVTMSATISIVAGCVALFIGLLVGFCVGMRAGIMPFQKLSDSVIESGARDGYNSSTPTLTKRIKRSLFCPIATNRCDSQTEPVLQPMNIEFNMKKLNNLSGQSETNLYTTSTKPVINIYESMCDNDSSEYSRHMEVDDEESHYADVIQSGSRASIAMIEEVDEDERETNLQVDSFFGEIDDRTKSLNHCGSNNYDCALQVPSAGSKRATLPTRLRGFLERFNNASLDTSSNGATSSSNSSVL